MHKIDCLSLYGDLGGTMSLRRGLLLHNRRLKQHFQLPKQFCNHLLALFDPHCAYMYAQGTIWIWVPEYTLSDE